MRAVVFADLDNTVMVQRARVPDGVAWTDGSVNRDGQVSSVQLAHHARLLELFSTAEVVPVTARDWDATERVCVPFAGPRIMCHGALVHGADGQADAEWEAHIAAERAEWAPRIAALRAAIEGTGLPERDPRFLFKMGHTQDGVASFVGLRGSLETVAELTRRRAELWSWVGALFRCNGDDLAFLPPFASKRRAVAFLKRRYLARDPDTLFVGVGDSAADLPFMAECHFVMAPTDSQIVRDFLPVDGVT